MKLVVLLVSLMAAAMGMGSADGSPSQAIRAADFLNSIGANSAIDRRGETLDKTIACAKYAGIRWFRAGVEGGIPPSEYARLHDETGIRVSWGLGSGGSNIDKLISTARELESESPGAILAFEGPNEPNNWAITYLGEKGGGRSSWLPLAQMQRDLYQAVKSDPALKKYPVWSISENGAETDNVGLQFLTIPEGSDTLMPPGTHYADFANVHNYIYHPNSPHPADNKTWNAADPGAACKVDGLYGEYGVTWAHHNQGYTAAQLETLPRVTTETGATVGGDITEEIHARNILTMYLDQFARGWSFTALYLLRDRVDESGNQQFGLFRPDYTPRKAADYLHNLTTILADNGSGAKSARLSYAIADQPETVHDLLLQKSNGTFELIVWDERIEERTDDVRIDLGGPVRTAVLYDPTIGIDPIRTLHGAASIKLTLSDHPIIIEIARNGRNS